MLAAAAGVGKGSHVALGLDHDARHHGYGLARVAATSGFRRKHDRVGAIEDGVGHVAGFGARGTRILDHRLEHLRGCDHRLTPLGGAADHVLLNDRNFFRRHLHAQIAASHHYAVGGFQYFFEMVDGLRLLQFGD